MMQEFVQEIENSIREATYDIHTAIPGTIVNFDPASGTATVKPSGKISMKNGEKMEYPQIIRVPVIFPRGKKFAVGYPVTPGDGCLIIVCENDLKPWASNGQETDSNMKFDLTNAVCIPGLFQKGNEAVKKATAENAIVLRNEDTEVVLKKDGITAGYKENYIRMEKTSVSIGCSSCGISVGRNGIHIEGDLNVNGTVSSKEGGTE